MNENVKSMCVCEIGYDKGALKKTIENNIFTIYGNINKNNYIVIRYHGELIDNICSENYNDNLYISYYFDDNREKSYLTNLAKCTKCIGESYCAIINLEEHNNIRFAFSLMNNSGTLYNESIQGNDNQSYKLDILNDPISDIFQKYNIEENATLPVIPQESTLKLTNFINNIKSFFYSLFKRKDIV